MAKQLTYTIDELFPSQKYKIVVNLGYDEVKKYYPRTSRIYYGTKRQADAFARSWVDELENPQEVYSKETVGEWLDFWLENDVPILLEWEQNTKQRAKGIINHNIKPNIGDKMISGITADDILNMYKKLSTTGGRKGKGISQRSIKYVHTILNQSLEQAVIRGKIPSNPAKGLTPAQSKVRDRDKWVVLDADQLHDFLDNIKFVKYKNGKTKLHEDYALIYTDSYSGFRQSEILGLTWERILWDTNYIRIDQTLHRSYEEDEDFEFRPRTKNETSTRDVDVPQRVMDVLAEHKMVQVARGISVDPKSLVFTDLKGNPIKANNLAKRFGTLAKQNGYPGMTFHHLRHTHATILLSAGAYINEVSERLGHATPLITLKTYGHVLPKNRGRLSAQFDSLLNKPEDKLD